MKRLNRKSSRRGVTAVEFALTVPLLLLFLFATYELGRANMMLHTTEAAAYEAARVAILPGANVEEAEEVARQVLITAGISNFEITFEPANLTQQTETVSATISMDYRENMTIFPFFLGENAGLNETCQLTRESFE